MPSTQKKMKLQRRVSYVPFIAAAALLAGCASSAKRDSARAPFSGVAPYSKTVVGSGDAVCWSVKRALLGQGYMLDRNVGRDRADIRSDRQSNLRNDRAVIAANSNDRGNGWDAQNAQTQRMSRNAVEPVKPALTTSNMANHAVENTRKTRTTQNLQKSWWHFW